MIACSGPAATDTGDDTAADTGDDTAADAGDDTAADTGDDASDDSSESGDKILIGLSNPNNANEANMQMNQGIDDYLATIDNVELIILDAEGKGENHLNHAETFITRGVDVAIISPYDAAVGQTAVEMLLDAGIPTITLKAAIADNSICTYVGQDDTIAGEMEMQWIADQIGGEGKIVVIEGPTGNSAAILRNEGINNVLANYPGIEVIHTQTGNWNREEGMTLMENWLQSGDEIDAVVAHNDEMALGAYDALVDAGLAGQMLVIGIDAIDAAMASVSNGEMDATVLQDSYGIGKYGIQIAVKLAQGETLDANYFVDPVLLTADNIGEYYTGE